MTCTPIKFADGVVGIVCTPRRWRRRCSCGAWAELFCDHPKRRGGTCDRAICRRCATEIGPDQHHCPEHREAPVQGALAL